MAQILDNNGGNKGGKVRAKKQSTAVDMTPLADLGFLLITFFMFTTTFSKPNVMGLNMPPKDPNKELNQDTPEIDLSNSISIIIGGDNKLYWHQQDKTKLTADQLYETSYSKEGIRNDILAARQRAKTPDNFTVIIKPTDESTYENLVNVLDEMEITESSRYGIVDIAPSEVAVYEEKSGTSSNN
ncbi:ExbD/TolR family protein [Moheibacter sp.]|uniref:ExbD/TolR family protein n=1 Tax=Moheibacter sp. TaxID=1965316 RepID=UPI003C780D2F